MYTVDECAVTFYFQLVLSTERQPSFVSFTPLLFLYQKPCMNVVIMFVKLEKKVYIKISSYGTQLMSQCAIYESIKDSQIPAYTQANWKLYFYLLQNYCMFREYSDFQVTQVISMFRTLLSINSLSLFHHNAKSLLILTLYSKLLSLVFVNIYM